jgi:DNA-nicking Smr family endonuclease
MAKQRTPPGSDDASTGDDARALHDTLAFRAAVRDVKPLKRTPEPKGLAKTRPRTRVRMSAPAGNSLDEVMPLLPVPPFVPGDGPSDAPQAAGAIGGADALSFQRAGVRTQVVRRLRRGLIPIEDELDLHGLSQTAARYQLAEFLTYSRNAGRRCVRIVHGKGYRSGARGPVLKTAVDLWLRRHLDVMAFTSARAIDGGTGAVYVLLRT